MLFFINTLDINFDFWDFDQCLENWHYLKKVINSCKQLYFCGIVLLIKYIKLYFLKFQIIILYFFCKFTIFFIEATYYLKYLDYNFFKICVNVLIYKKLSMQFKWSFLYINYNSGFFISDINFSQITWFTSCSTLQFVHNGLFVIWIRINVVARL